MRKSIKMLKQEPMHLKNKMLRGNKLNQKKEKGTMQE